MNNPGVFTVLGLLLYVIRTDSAVLTDTRGPVFIYEPPNQVDFSNNTGARIECTAHGVPAPTVHWLRADGTNVDEIAGLQKVLSNGTLLFKPFRAEDYRQDIHAVVYKCVASNPMGTIVSRDVRVRGVVKQFYEVQVYDEFVIKGNIAVLKCHVPSFVRDHLAIDAWLRDDAVITHSSPGRIVISRTGELYIRDVGPKDSQKNYRCRTVHRLTEEVRLSSPGRLIITDPQSSVPPRLTHSVISVQARQGDTAELPCTAQGFPVPTYRWYKLQGKQIALLEQSDRIRQQYNLFIIKNVDLRDAGTYVCVINNSVGEEKVETVLTVSASLSAYIEPQQQTVDVGKPTQMTCVTSGSPITSVSWSKDAKPVEIGTFFRLPRREVLQIPAVQREHRGMYQCFAENEEESVQATAELRLGDAAPGFHSSFQEQTVQPGTPTSLQCIVTGNPIPEVTWTLDGSSLPVNRRFQTGSYVSASGDVISHVNISHARVEDGGEYGCKAVNSLGTVHHSARLNVWGLPFIRQMANLTVVAGKTIAVRCPASGYPIHSISWERDGNILPAALRQTVFPNGTLMVRSVERTDAGSYTCIARNNKGLSARKSMWVSVLDPPKIEPFGFPKDVREGMRARVLCSVVEGDPPVSITWTKDDGPFPADLGASIQSTDEFSSILTFRSVAAAHNGNYTCTASNAAATVSHRAELLVHVPPRWLQEPKDLNVLLGKPVTLQCQAGGFPKPNITWMKGTGKVPGNYQDVRYYNERATILSNGSLRIEAVQKKDDGYYLCQAANGIGSGLSKVVYLTVNVPAYFEIKHRNQTAQKGEEIRIQCEAWGDRPLQVLWNRNGRRIEYEAEHRFTTVTRDQDGSILAELIIRVADKSDSALFTCIATNGFGHDESTIQLLIEEKPTPPTNTQVTEFTSRSATLKWVLPSDGNSAIVRHIIQVKSPEDSWKTPMNVTIEGTATSGNVHRLLPGATYHMRVIAENRLGPSLPGEPVEVTTNEEAPSGPPLAVEAKATNSESLKVVWKPPKKELWNGEILGYYAGYKIYDSSEPYHYKTVEVNRDAETVELHLTNLRKFTKYSVMVQAFNRMGGGPHSDEVVAVTSEDVPSEPPQNVQCITHTSQSLHVTWAPPPLASQNGVIRGYKVFYKPTLEFDDDVEYHISTTTALKTNLHSLEKYTNYSVQALAYTRIGDGARSDPVYCRTLEDVPGPPADIKALTMSSDSALVTWRPPNNRNGNIIKYTLYIRSADNGKQHTSKHFLSSAPHLLHEARALTENRNYEFWVTASTVIGEGESTRVVTQAPKSKVMARIASFSEKIVTKWKEDMNLPCRAVGLPTPTRNWITEGDKLLHESNRFSVLGDGSLHIRHVLSTDSGNYSCEVENIYGKDQITYKLIVQAPPASPSLKIVESSASSILLKVVSRNEGNSKVKGYTLSYKRDFGEWEEMEIHHKDDSISLDNLFCGTRYHLYLTAYNKVGAGEPSDIVSVSTKGEAPKAPKMDDVLSPNTTFLSLSLYNWPDGGCQILYFVVQYKLANRRDWFLVSNNVQPHQRDLVITDLSPGTRYNVQVTAHNDAGSTVAEFDVKTLTINGDVLAPGMAADEGSPEHHFFHGWNTLAPIVISAIILTIALLFAGCFFLRRMKYRGYRHSYPGADVKAPTDNPMKTALENGSGGVEMTFTPSPGRKFTLTGNRTLTRGDFNITACREGYPDNTNPYATFNLPGCQGLSEMDAHALQLQTRTPRTTDQRNFNQIQFENTNPSDLYSRVVKRHSSQLHTEETNQRNAPNPKFYPATDGTNPVPKATAPELYTSSLNYEQPYQQWETRRGPSEYDSVLSDSDNSELGGSYFSESTVQLHGRNTVPDLIYHTTDSSSSNVSSPEEERRRSRPVKNKFYRGKNPLAPNLRAPYNEERVEQIPCTEETTFTYSSKIAPPVNYADHVFQESQLEVEGTGRIKNGTT